METKICSKCGINKELSEFGKRKDSKSGFRSECKSCFKEYHKSWRVSNPKKYLQYDERYKKNNPTSFNLKKKTYKEKHKEKIREYNRQWRINNKEYINNYSKNRQKTDPLFHLIILVRNRINNFLQIRKITKRNTTIEIVGCTPEFLKHHIESQFTEGMSWELLGKLIHIDHIIPLSSAQTEEEIYKLCHYTNLQPLWWCDNLKKSNKII